MNEERGILVAYGSSIYIQSSNDISEAVGLCLGAKGLILTEDDFVPEFFDLRTGLAGELFQKCTNYRLRIAIVLPTPEALGGRISELAYEHASHNLIRFVRSTEEAQAWLNA
jgi:hypothetical protein